MTKLGKLVKEVVALRRCFDVRMGRGQGWLREGGVVRTGREFGDWTE